MQREFQGKDRALTRPVTMEDERAAQFLGRQRAAVRAESRTRHLSHPDSVREGTKPLVGRSFMGWRGILARRQL